MDINITGQKSKADALRPYLVQLKNEIEKRYPIWERIPPEKRLAWVQAAAVKDPLFDLFVDIVRYTRKWEISDG